MKKFFALVAAGLATFAFSTPALADTHALHSHKMWHEITDYSDKAVLQVFHHRSHNFLDKPMGQITVRRLPTVLERAGAWPGTDNHHMADHNWRAMHHWGNGAQGQVVCWEMPDVMVPDMPPMPPMPAYTPMAEPAPMEMMAPPMEMPKAKKHKKHRKSKKSKKAKKVEDPMAAPTGETSK